MRSNSMGNDTTRHMANSEGRLPQIVHADSCDTMDARTDDS